MHKAIVFGPLPASRHGLVVRCPCLRCSDARSLASPADPRVGQWNMGLLGANNLSKYGVIHAQLRVAGARFKPMSKHVHVVAFNEVGPAFHAEFDEHLAKVAPRVRMVATSSGDTLVWCHAANNGNSICGCCCCCSMW